ncbi:MAG: hypothetical protein HY763_14885 [Planctomycetes bacterium]|nr:hypothetical protein [Planctomycetota bacterium]
MIQVCIMSGHEGRMQLEKKLYFTLMGGMELIRPTLARQILAQRQYERQGESRPRRQFFLTVMGGVEIKYPTLAEEFIDLREMIQSGALSMGDWERAMADLGRTEVAVASFTLMGGFEECSLPTESEEIDSLAIQRHLGNIPERASQVLQLGIGQRDAERRSTLRRALVMEPAYGA